jgi:hypothetical protein
VKKFTITLCCLTAVLSQAALASPNPALGFDVNDVSYLLPTSFFLENAAQIGIGFDTLSLVDGQAILPRPIFEKIVSKMVSELHLPAINFPFPHPEKVDRKYGAWRMVAFRYDPCANIAEDVRGPKCDEEVRLSFQPVSTAEELGYQDRPPGQLQLGNSAIHLIFRIGQGQFGAAGSLSFPQWLLKLRDDIHSWGAETRGIPLGPHPLRDLPEARRQLAFKSLKNLILRRIANNLLTDFTFALVTEDDENWHFFGGRVVGGEWHPAPIPNLDNTEPFSDDRIVRFYAPDRRWFPRVKPNSGPSALNALVSGDFSSGQIEQLHRIENPTLAGRHSVDCVSCHVSSAIINRFEIPFGAATSEFRNPLGVTGFAVPTRFNRNLNASRNFGYVFPNSRKYSPYFGPAVSSLAANSSAWVAAYLNTSLRLEKPNPKDCSNPEVRACFAGRMPELTGGCLGLCR